MRNTVSYSARDLKYWEVNEAVPLLHWCSSWAQGYTEVLGLDEGMPIRRINFDMGLFILMQYEQIFLISLKLLLIFEYIPHI